MKEVIVLRHGEKQGDELTSAGVLACQALAERIGTIHKAIASERHRATQTAQIISGLVVHVDSRANVPDFPNSEIDNLVSEQRTNPLGIIGAIWQKPALVEDARIAGGRLKELVEDTLVGLDEGQRALIVSHDGSMIGLEKLLRNESFENVDHSFGPLQGFSIDENLRVEPFA
jgi:broad specificity phosphatase PhoE